MNDNFWLIGHLVTLPEMLFGREHRACEQREMLEKYGRHDTLVCFTLNIAGPVKVFPLAEESFEEGCREIRARLHAGHFSVAEEKILRADYGWEAYFAVGGDCTKVKRVLTVLEEEHPLGRLFDIDVLNGAGEKASRQEIGYPPRTCLICGRMAAECARSRAHPVATLQARTVEMMLDFWRTRELSAAMVGRLCRQALLREVYTTPKPGLVDLRNTGAHMDMDVPLFETSARALEPYFAACYEAGTASDCAPERLLAKLRPLGIRAEKEMFAATGGVNTHKGMIFSLGIICGALGLMQAGQQSGDAEGLLLLAGQVAAPVLDWDFRQALTGLTKDGDRRPPATAGEEQYLSYGITGIRGEAAGGFASIRRYALPYFRKLLAAGEGSERAGTLTLLQLIAHVTDTNIIARAGIEVQQELQQKVRELLQKEELPAEEEIERLDELFTSKNVSPGGCADLLAIVYFLQELESLEFIQ